MGYESTLVSFIACGKEACGTVKSRGFQFGENMVFVLIITLISRNGEEWGAKSKRFYLLLFFVKNFIYYFWDF